MADDTLPHGSLLIERDGLPPGCNLLKHLDGSVDILHGDRGVLATIRFDVDVETLAIFIHDRPFPAAESRRPRGRRLSAGCDPERLLAQYLEAAPRAAAA